MKSNIHGNVILQKNESIQKQFKNMKAKNKLCSMMLTTKRLIIYTFGLETEKGKKLRRRIMNEIDIRSIHRFEYYLEYPRGTGLKRFFAFLFVIFFGAVLYGNYSGLLASYLPVAANYTLYIYGGAAFFFLISVILLFRNRSMLALRIKSGMEEKTSINFFPTKRNEEALKFIAGKIHVE